MRTLNVEGTLVITNHNQPEAVILSARAYEELLHKAGQAEARTESELVRLRQRFDERLAVLSKPDAGERLRSVLKGPARLRGRVKAGGGY
jgi:PHD/YefM family antitoxin component YafN of YafNO toxin-antitoxin module